MRRTLILLAFMIFFCRPSYGAHIFYEYGLGQVTAGYDPITNKTTILKWYFAAKGPGDLKEETYQFARTCAKSGLEAAGAAGYATPGELSAKLAAAYQTWMTVFPKCMTGDKLAKHLIAKFELGLTEQRIEVPGLVLRAMSNNPSAKIYQKLYEEAEKRLPGGDVSNALKSYFKLNAQAHEAMQVNIDIAVPEEITNLAGRKQALALQEASKQVANLAAELQHKASPKKIAEIVPQAMRLTDGVTQQIAQATGAIANVESILPKLPKGFAIPTLGNDVRYVSKALSEAGEAVNETLRKKPEKIKKCTEGNIEECGDVVTPPIPSVDDAKQCALGKLEKCAKVFPLPSPSIPPLPIVRNPFN